MSLPEMEKREFDGLVQALCDELLDKAGESRLRELLVKHEDAQTLYIQALDLHANLAWDLRDRPPVLLRQSAPSPSTGDMWHGLPAHDESDHGQDARATFPRSPILGFLNNWMQVGGESAGATFFQWAVLGMIGTGMVTMIVMVAMLTLHAGGWSVAGGRNGIAKSEISNAKSPPLPLGEGRGEGGQNAGRSHSSAANPEANASGSPPQFAARLIGVADAHWRAGKNAPNKGDDLFEGRRVQLDAGIAEFIFQGGAKVILQGPAQMEFLSRAGARLVYGSLTVTVENPLARGFEVHTSGMKYTDLGTEFGVSVGRDGQQEMDVFRGRVAAEVERIDPKSPHLPLGEGRGEGASTNPEAADRNGRTASGSPPTTDHRPPATPLILTADQVLKIAAPGKPIEQVPANDKQFVRDMPAPGCFPLFSTGVGVKIGEPDRHWELAMISTDKNFKPQRAVVYQPPPQFVRDEHGRAQWISKTATNNVMPDGCRWTLRTHFDLTGYDPATARIEGRIAIDDYLVEIRLNGKKLPIKAFSRKKPQSTNWNPLKIEAGFAAGDNLLEVVIENRVTAMGLCVDWQGTARPASKPKAGD